MKTVIGKHAFCSDFAELIAELIERLPGPSWRSTDPAGKPLLALFISTRGLLSVQHGSRFLLLNCESSLCVLCSDVLPRISQVLRLTVGLNGDIAVCT